MTSAYLCQQMDKSVNVQGHPGQHSQTRSQLLLQVCDVWLQKRLHDASQAAHDARMLCDNM